MYAQCIVTGVHIPFAGDLLHLVAAGDGENAALPVVAVVADGDLPLRDLVEVDVDLEDEIGKMKHHVVSSILPDLAPCGVRLEVHIRLHGLKKNYKINILMSFLDLLGSINKTLPSLHIIIYIVMILHL